MARKGDWLHTISGRQFWPLDPQPEEVAIDDIAHGLAHICRFNGHLPEFYSVAQHSVLTSHMVPRSDACECQQSGGQYNKDLMTATIGGCARVLGIGNPFFNELYPMLNEEAKAALRQRMYGQPTDAWWGEYPGDVQLFRIECAYGPRLAVRVVRVSETENKVIIIDKRPYTIDKKSNVKSVVVPANPKPSYRV